MSYEFMKTTNIKWLNKIPEQWEMKKYKEIFYFVGGHGFPEGLQGQLTGDYPFYKVSDINGKGKYVTSSNNYVNQNHIQENKWRIIAGDAILIAKIGEALKKNHRKINKSNCLIDNNLMAFVLKRGNITYLYHLLTIVDMIWYSNPGAIPSINVKHIKEDLLPFPSLKEQEEIANYLDEKISGIDNIINKKIKFVQLLEEKRQSIVTEAVTKGLNPNMKMKDSGVEWIGEIPEHWEMTRLDFLARVKARLGWKGLKAEEYVDEGYIFLSTPNLKGREIDFNNVNYITEERYLESPEIMLKEGDILLAKDGSTLGITNVVRKLPKETTVNSSVAVLRPTEKIHSIYFYYYLTSTYIQDTINQIKDGMGVPHLFQADIKKFKVVLPPIKEQIEIAKYLDNETLVIENNISLVKRQIAKLKEYRQSLIYEAVTGKIDVRELVTEA